MIEKNEKQSVDYNEAKFEILHRVESVGSLWSMDSWRKAFSEVVFVEKEEIVGEIDWNKKTIAERTFYVAYMMCPEKAEVTYQIQIDNVDFEKRVTDPDHLWWMWLDGCFSGEELDEVALRTFIQYLDDREGCGEALYDQDLDQVEVLSIEAKVGKI